jgi:hypothetical protein
MRPIDLKYFACMCFAATILSAASTTTVTLVNAGVPPEVDSGGYYVGPYTLNLQGTNIAALCIDFSDQSTVGAVWQANLSNLAGSIANTYHPNSLQQYEEAAWLYSQIILPNADRLDIQHAAWALLDPQYTINSAAQQWVDLAEQNYTTVLLGNFIIISDVSTVSTHEQEFIIDPSAFAPEPGTFALAALALLLAALGSRRFRGLRRRLRS